MRCRTLEKAWNRIGGSCKHNNAEPLPHEIVIFDGYYYTNEEKHQTILNGNIVVTITEFDSPVVSHIIVNQNLGAEKYSYPFADVQLLGTDYFLLRDEIRYANAEWGISIFDADKVNRSLSPGEFALKLSTAKAVICSAGQTAYESVYLGKPTLIRMVAENQKLTHTMLIKHRWAHPATPHNIESLEHGVYFNRPQAKTLIDGEGADRVAKEIYQYWKSKHVKTA
jgi:spore coat polysaccharide biosynthesis predicted glycosyltransferase SpsG